SSRTAGSCGRSRARRCFAFGTSTCGRGSSCREGGCRFGVRGQARGQRASGEPQLDAGREHSLKPRSEAILAAETTSWLRTEANPGGRPPLEERRQAASSRTGSTIARAGSQGSGIAVERLAQAILRKPSDGLEPSTLSYHALLSAPRRNRRQRFW